MTIDVNNSDTILALKFVGKALKCAYFDNLSTTTMMTVFSWANGIAQ